MKSTIFAEEPEEELWRCLLKYSYKSNIKRYFKDHDIKTKENHTDGNSFDIIADAVAGAMLQASEYYSASKLVSLHVEPLMLYYGTTNLLYAMSILLSGEKINIKNHGMRIVMDKQRGYIANTKIIFNNHQDGGIHIYAKNLGFTKDLCSYNKKEWKLYDFIDSIAEIQEDFDRCYLNRISKIHMLDIVKTAEGIIEKVPITEGQINIMHIEDFSKAYLRPQFITNKNDGDCLILHRKMNGKTISKYAYSGQPYLQEAHNIDNILITVPEELNMYISLFILGSLCRYYPDVWYPFVTQDSTGEKLIVEKLLYFSRRILPNVILNKIEGYQIVFVSNKYIPDNKIHLVGEHEIKEMVNKEIKKYIRQQQLINAIQNG